MKRWNDTVNSGEHKADPSVLTGSTELRKAQPKTYTVEVWVNRPEAPGSELRDKEAEKKVT